MNPPPSDDMGTSDAAGLLEEISAALRSGRLAGLLKGAGLSKSTVDELLRPESASRLEAILTDHLSPERGRGAEKGRRDSGEDDPGQMTADGSRRGGKVLAFQAKETFRP